MNHNEATLEPIPGALNLKAQLVTTQNAADHDLQSRSTYPH